jgi:hypothetical protein
VMSGFGELVITAIFKARPVGRASRITKSPNP